VPDAVTTAMGSSIAGPGTVRVASVPEASYSAISSEPLLDFAVWQRPMMADHFFLRESRQQDCEVVAPARRILSGSVPLDRGPSQNVLDPSAKSSGRCRLTAR
jgi:hypothetical protein